MRKRRPRLAALTAAILACALALAPAVARAQDGDVRFIRDAEIEETIRAYSRPIFQAAGLPPQRIDVYLIANPALNAFVAGGMDMYIHTGLLQRAEDPLQVMGVIAHEAGHISAGHLAGRREELERTAASMIASALLGLGTAVATGRGEAAAAVTSFGSTLALSDLMSYSRAQEGSADQAAISYLERAGYAPVGLLEFMRLLEDQEVLLRRSQAPWLRTHPLTRERVNAIAEATEQAKARGLKSAVSDDLRQRHARMRAKLDGFLNPPQDVLDSYPADSDAIADRYARAIARYRVPELSKALDLIDGLIEQRPQDPYFRELKGQMLFENGRIEAALPPYETAVELAPEQPLLRMGLAEVQLQLNRPALNEKALANAERVVDAEPDNAFAWRLVGIAHGRMGDRGEAALALAEYALHRGDLSQAVGQAQRAQGLLDKHSPGWLRAQDIERTAERRRERRG